MGLFFGLRGAKKIIYNKRAIVCNIYRANLFIENINNNYVQLNTIAFLKTADKMLAQKNGSKRI